MIASARFWIRSRGLAFAVRLSRHGLVVADGIMEVIFVNEILSRVVRRIDVDHLDLAIVGALQELQHLEIVTLDVEVFTVELAGCAVLAGTFRNAGTERAHRGTEREGAVLFLLVPSETVVVLRAVHGLSERTLQGVEVDLPFRKRLGDERLQLGETFRHHVFRHSVHLRQFHILSSVSVEFLDL